MLDLLHIFRWSAKARQTNKLILYEFKTFVYYIHIYHKVSDDNLTRCMLGPSNAFKKALGHFLSQYFALTEEDLIQSVCNF